MSYSLGLRPGVDYAVGEDSVTLRRARASLRVARTDAIQHVVQGLAGGTRTRTALVQRAADPVATMRGTALLDRLAGLSWLTYSIHSPGESGPSVTTAVPIAPDPTAGMPAQPWSVDPLDGGVVGLSRFAYAQWRDRVLVLRSPLSGYEVRATGPALAHLLSQLPDRPEAVDSPELLDLLYRARLTTVDPDRGGREADDTVLRQWEFHDLLFHAMARDGRRDRVSGATYRFRGDADPALAPLRAVRPAFTGATVELPEPSPDPATDAITLTAALRDRASIRAHGDPITLDQLSAFLYRSARTTYLGTDGEIEVSGRPYPNGGAIHELELYVLARDCSGLDRGLYHYRTAQHALTRVADSDGQVEALLSDAGYSMGYPPPQVLIVITSRFQRLAWKYESIAYALTLKHVGCLLQTMYLTATAMGLAPCAIGGGNSEIFARAAGLSPLVEPSVGEFALGTRVTRATPGRA